MEKSEELTIITPREGDEVERIREAKRIINANLDTNMDDLYGPLSQVLGIERDGAAEIFILGIVIGFDSEENLAKKLIK